MDVDYYAILECDRNSTDADIKKQFRKLAMKWHPDKNTDKDEVFLIISLSIYKCKKILGEFEIPRDRRGLRCVE